jgi:diguanylate cyclase (GGDEF)-like protein
MGASTDRNEPEPGSATGAADDDGRGAFLSDEARMAALEHRSRLLDLILDRMAQGLMLINKDQVVELCNARARELLRLPPALMVSNPRVVDVLEYQWSTDEFSHTPEELKAFVRGGGIVELPHRYERRRPDGQVLEIESIPLEDGGVLRTYTDITERRLGEERIRHRARHDGLTSLLNREAFGELLASNVMKSTTDGRGFAVHYLDLDRFKPVNDQLGHAAGDQVLAAVAQRMREVARDHDAVARLGGDEFAILQLYVDEDEQAEGLAHRLVDAMKTPIHIDGHEIELGLSVGIAIFPGHGVTADSLLRHADAALYRAKTAGGNGFRICE